MHLGLLVIFTVPAPVALVREANSHYEHAVQLQQDNDAVAAIFELICAPQVDFGHRSSRLLAGEIYLDQGHSAAAKGGAVSNTIMPVLVMTLVQQGVNA